MKISVAILTMIPEELTFFLKTLATIILVSKGRNRLNGNANSEDN